MSEQSPEQTTDASYESPEQLDGTEGSGSGAANPSGAIKTQRAIIDSELFWYGRLMDSDQVHEAAGTPYEGPRDFF